MEERGERKVREEGSMGRSEGERERKRGGRKSGEEG